jgi:hypothetical protein
MPWNKATAFCMCVVRDWENSQVGPVIGAQEAELARRQTFGHYATGPPISRSMFNRMWRERHSNVKVCLFFVFVLLVVVLWECLSYSANIVWVILMLQCAHL